MGISHTAMNKIISKLHGTNIREKLHNAILRFQTKPYSARMVLKTLNEMGLKPRKTTKKPMLKQKFKEHRLLQSQQYAIWTSNDSKRAIFLDEQKLNLVEKYNASNIQSTVKYSPY